MNAVCEASPPQISDSLQQSDQDSVVMNNTKKENEKVGRDDFVPIFMPNKQCGSNSPALMRVSKEVFDTMIVVFPLVISELKRHSSQNRKFDAIYDRLNYERWCPCEIDSIHVYCHFGQVSACS